MSVPRYQFRQCDRKDCRFRFPVLANSSLGKTCPYCGAATKLVVAPYTDHQVKVIENPPDRPQVEVLLDNIRSIFNVGSLFRTADGAGIRYLHLCGITPTPDHPKFTKTALGSEKAVAWAHYSDGVAAAVTLKEQGRRLWALEGGPRAESLFQAIPDLYGPTIVLVIGNEVSGVDPAILEQCERILSIPMQGVKNTLNVSVAFGIAAYFLRYALPALQNGRVPEPRND